DAMSYAAGLDAAAFETMPEVDRKTCRALKNALVEIGGSVKSLPQDLTGRHPQVDWRGLAGLRDIVAHPYYRLDMQRLRPVLTDEFPNLVAAIAAELGDVPTPPDGQDT
ncbi:MAG TPA: HepT-like ribonuclease domain-containing protein, partial [Microvirga sp.]|nr:HepT-like ribonuclease domain-containing protein [Microvirga sp.]